jgi:hypothetical protein
MALHRSKTRKPMSALGKRTLTRSLHMSAIPPKADIGTHSRDVRYVPKADILRCSEEHPYSIASPACGCVQFTFLDTL